MATTDTPPAVARRSVVAAAPRPCAHCPWRTENHGRRERHGFYSLQNLRRLWDGLRTGERMTCHPTDPTMAEFAGYEATAACQQTRERAGALVMVQRELTRLDHAVRQARATGRGDGVAHYQRLVGRAALTRGGAAAHVFAMTAGRTPLCGGVEIRHVNLNEPGIGMPDLPAWGALALDPAHASGTPAEPASTAPGHPEAPANHLQPKGTKP